MAGSLIVTALLTISLFIFGAYYYFDPLGNRTSTRSRAEELSHPIIPDNQTPITPVESKFSQLLTGKSSVPTESLTPTPGAVSTLPFAIQPTLVAELSSDKRNVLLKFGNLTEVVKLTYFITYIAKAGAKGITGTIQVPSPSAPINRQVVLGTCSGNTCVYDEVTTPIDVRVIYSMSDSRSVELTKTVPY